MNPFIQQLFDLLTSLTPAPGTPSEAIRDLLHAQAAVLILQNPANAVIPAGQLDPQIAEAIQAGASQAAALTAAGKQLRLLQEQLPFGTTVSASPERRSQPLGPFVGKTGQVTRFVTIESPAFLGVNLILPPGSPSRTLLLMLIPQGATTSSDRKTWQLPAGTVWIQARFFAANTENFVGVRIAGGTLTLNLGAVPRPGIFLSPGTSWVLSVDLEQPPAPAPGATSDAEALHLQLPTQLLVSTSGAPSLTGGLTLSGFGDELHFTASGPPVLEGNQIAFPLHADEPSWSISANLSRIVQFSGKASIINPRMALPLCSTPTTNIGEASHAGSLVVTLGDGLTSTLRAQAGDPIHWSAGTISCNAEQIEIRSLQPVSGPRYELELWNPSLTRLRLTSSLSFVSFRSERGGLDGVALSGGGCINQWDLPRRSDGKPFQFDAAIDLFGLYTSPSTVSFTLLATTSAATGLDDFAGLTLENVHFLVRSPRRLALNASFDTAPALPAGTASVFFDVGLAVPTLPDPYAANMTPSRNDVAVSEALRVVMPWLGGAAPTLSVNVDAPVPFPNGVLDLSADPDEQAVRGAFQSHLQSNSESLLLLDLSSREHLFGVAIEPVGTSQAEIIDNRLSAQLNRVRLLMQPQVLWEPVQFEPAPSVGVAFGHSSLGGGPTLLGANSVKLVPLLPSSLSDELLEAIGARSPAAALFSLPFGLRAMAQLDFVDFPHLPEPVFLPATETSHHEPAFGDLTSARQVRLVARQHGLFPDGPSSMMPGMLRQLANFTSPAPVGATSVLPTELLPAFTRAFSGGIPLQYADLSGYGLSTFSKWHQDVEEPFGATVTKVEFQVLNGRTAYEVVQFRSILFECGARVIRSIFLERHSSGRVLRTDTGWVAIDAGDFKRPDAFQTGAVRAFRNIRRIRIVAPVLSLDPSTTFQPVVFDADVDLEGAIGGMVPLYDRPGYIQLTPSEIPRPEVSQPPINEVRKQTLKQLLDRVHAIGGPVDCAVRVGGTLEAQISSIVSDTALDDGNGLGFAVAIVGGPKLPRAGQWSFVRLDPITHEPSAVDAHRGVPLVRNGSGSFKFREPADTRRTDPVVEYALLMATDASRALFKAARIDPAQAGKLLFDVPPIFADPHSLAQATGAFPHPNLALPLKELASFTISPEDLWHIDNSVFTLASPPLRSFMQGGGWGLNRDYDLTVDPHIILGIDSAVPAPFRQAVPPTLLTLNLPGLGDVIQIKSKFAAAAGELSKLADPTLAFFGKLQDLTDVLDTFAHLTGLPFHFDVSITGGSGASPSFVVHLSLLFRIGDGPDGRVEIGVGKFYGQFTVKGELEAALTGVERALLFIEFQGDVQQGIFPPLLYAGGLFRFSVELHETGGPLIQLTLGIVISIGGDLIPGLLAVEGTIKYGYSLVPETLQPGVLLGVEARAKLLAGLIGFSFSAEVLARIRRNNPATVTIFAAIRIAASVHVAIFFDEDIDFETQFHQDIPLAALGLLPGVGMAVLAAEAPV